MTCKQCENFTTKCNICVREIKRIKKKKKKQRCHSRYNNVSDVRLVTQKCIHILILIIDSMKNRFFAHKKNANSFIICQFKIVMVEKRKRNLLFA